MGRMLMTGTAQMDAERAFARETRARRRSATWRRLRGVPTDCRRLAVYDDPPRPGARAVRAIPIAAITGTIEPTRAKLFDDRFRPTSRARDRWLRVWIAEHCGVTLPPISVVRVGDGYAVSDGHHRVSVARARGAVTIDAAVEAVPA
jgi:hypothetical protein